MNRPTTYTYHNLGDACEWVQATWPKLKDTDFWEFVQHEELRNNTLVNIEYLSDILELDEEWSYMIDNGYYGYTDSDRQNLIKFRAILMAEFGTDFLVDW